MLTADLLHYTRRNGRLKPRLLDPQDGRLAGLAGELIDLVASHMGERRGDLETALRMAGAPGVAPRIVQGLARLLLERCTFEQDAPVEPRALRSALFDGAARAWRREGAAGLTAWRAGLLEREGRAHGLAPDQVEAALFADLAENQRLRELRPIRPEALLFRYNCAQVQGLLLSAERVALTAAWPGPRRLRQLFRYLKFYGLLFRQEAGEPGARSAADGSPGPEALHLVVDGPASVLEGGTRYGMNLALFFPALLLWKHPWTMRALLRLRKRGTAETFELTPHPWLRSHYPDQGQWVPDDVRAFVSAFNAKGSDWSAEPADELLAAPGNRSLIPDFRFRHGPTGRVVFLEYLPYPLAERVAQRLALVAARGEDDYLLACRGVPAVQPLQASSPSLVTFRRNLVPGVVRQALRAYA